jgi:radical SAM-linked protein
LSHAETLRFFRRACVRAGVKVAYSQGFNPHPKMSLVLPRSVGVVSEDELLCLWLEKDQAGIDVEALKKQMPEGVEIVSVRISQKKKVPEPVAAQYLIKVKEQSKAQRIKSMIDEMSSKNEITVQRWVDGGPRVKIIDVRPFLRSIKVEEGVVIADCAISPSGTIRVDEILGLLDLKHDDLSAPVRRVSVQYLQC